MNLAPFMHKMLRQDGIGPKSNLGHAVELFVILAFMYHPLVAYRMNRIQVLSRPTRYLPPQDTCVVCFTAESQTKIGATL